MADHGLPLRIGRNHALLRLLALPLWRIEAARGHLLPLAVVIYGIGIGCWFALDLEPRGGDYLLALAFVACGLWGAWAAPDPCRSLGAICLALALGFLAAGLRAHLQWAPMLSSRYYGPIEGRVIEIDRSGSDALRLTLDQVILASFAPEDTPDRVRLSLLSARLHIAPLPGQRVILTGHLSPPEGPAEPEGFDFRRMAYFERLGAVGYSRTPVLLLEPARGLDQMIGQLRHRFSAAIRSHIAGEAGAFAAGAMTGDRSGISKATVIALRDSSLAHILAISGMKLACLAAFVFALVRGVVALVPWLALRLHGKKIAAAVALPVAYFYLLLSGSNLATERAFVMAAVMLVAVLCDRRALTLRAAAIAGGVILTLRPESLLAPGFQMSMAATLALIAGFHAMEPIFRARAMAFGLRPLLVVVLSSVIGGLATAPYAAAHFNRFADYGLLANLLTVPAIGFAIMPMGVMAFLLAPLGLSALPLWIMGLASEWILAVAYRVASWEGAVTGIAAPHPWALALVTLAGLWLILWPDRGRWLGGIGLALGLALWPMADRPDLLIAGDGALLGVRAAEGRSLSSAKGNRLVAETWLENDGDLASREIAAARQGFSGPPEALRFEIGGRSGVYLKGAEGLSNLAPACVGREIIILDQKAEHAVKESGFDIPPQCPWIGPRLLRQTGPLAIWVREEGLVIRATWRERIWTSPTRGGQGAARLPDFRRNEASRPDAEQPTP